MQNMTIREQIRAASLALYAGACGAGFGLLLGFYSYQGGIFYDLQSGPTCAGIFGGAAALAVIICALWPNWLDK